MDKQTLKYFFSEISNDKPIEYPKTIKTNLIHVAQQELKKLKIPFEVNNKNILSLYNTSATPLRYVKGFYPNNTRLGKLICQDKFLTQQFLNYSNIETPLGRMFKPKDLDKAIKFISSSDNQSFVLKPVSMSMSLGTFLNVNNENLKSCWDESFKVQEKYNVKSPGVLIQEQLSGLELRIIVVEGRIGSAVFRCPGNIKGDGVHTIEELIHMKNDERHKHNYLSKNPLKINKNLIRNLSKSALTLESILPLDEYYILYSESDIATGREVFEVSKYLHDNIFKQALDAVTAIPGVHTAGVDIFIDALSATHGTIIEVNLNPAFQLHYYPMTGEPTAPLNDVFKYNKLDRRILNDEMDLESINREEFNLVIERYKFLYRRL